MTTTTSPRPRMGALGTTLAIAGAVALLGTGGTAAFAASHQLGARDVELTANAAGATGVDVEAGRGQIDVFFGDVAQAELRVAGGQGDAWSLERDDDELVVRGPESAFGWLTAGVGPDVRATLVLPETLAGEGFDADVRVSAGRVTLDGEYGALEASVGAGALRIDGAVRTLDVSIDAGSAEVRLDGVQEADLEVSAGRLQAELTGAPPTRVDLGVSAGSLDLVVPDAAYAVSRDVSAGSLRSSVSEDAAAPRSIHATVSAGSASIRPER